MKKNLIVRCNKDGVFIHDKGVIKEYKFNVVKSVDKNVINNSINNENISHYLENNRYNIHYSEKRKKQLFNKNNLHIIYPKIVNQLFLSLPKES